MVGTRRLELRFFHIAFCCVGVKNQNLRFFRFVYFDFKKDNLICVTNLMEIKIDLTHVDMVSIVYTGDEQSVD